MPIVSFSLLKATLKANHTGEKDNTEVLFKNCPWFEREEISRWRIAVLWKNHATRKKHDQTDVPCKTFNTRATIFSSIVSDITLLFELNGAGKAFSIAVRFHANNTTRTKYTQHFLSNSCKSKFVLIVKIHCIA